MVLRLIQHRYPIIRQNISEVETIIREFDNKKDMIRHHWGLKMNWLFYKSWQKYAIIIFNLQNVSYRVLDLFFDKF